MNELNLSIEQLMMDALDGTLTPRGRKMLLEYLTLHPAEKAEYDRLVSVELALRSDPKPLALPSLTQQVIDTVAQTRIMPPVLRLSQIAFLVGMASFALAAAGTVAVAFYQLVSPSFPTAEIAACVALFKAIVDVGAAMVYIVLTCVRTVYSQPVSWAVSMVLAAMVAFWVRLVLKLWIPGAPTIAR